MLGLAQKQRLFPTLWPGPASPHPPFNIRRLFFSSRRSAGEGAVGAPPHLVATQPCSQTYSGAVALLVRPRGPLICPGPLLDWAQWAYCLRQWLLKLVAEIMPFDALISPPLDRGNLCYHDTGKNILPRTQMARNCSCETVCVFQQICGREQAFFVLINISVIRQTKFRD